MDGRRLEMVNRPSDPTVPRRQFMQQRYDLSRRRAAPFSTTYTPRTRSTALRYQLLSIIIFSKCREYGICASPTKQTVSR